MFADVLTQERIAERLHPVLATQAESVVPCRVELLPNNTYALNYAWMYSFEKQLKYRIEELSNKKLSYSQEKTLFGPGGAVSEGLSNAFAHGHKKDPRKAIDIWVCVSRRGLGFTISDQGEGFDYQAILRRYQSGESFYLIAGNGFSNLYNSTELVASYTQAGTRLGILYLFTRP